VIAMNKNGRGTRSFLPQAERCEGRLLLSGATRRTGILLLPGGQDHPVRPNTPVLPFGAASNAATFIDPSAGVIQGTRITLGARVFIAPFAALDATAGAIRVGQNSAILDNASLIANSSGAPGSPEITIGERVIVNYGAMILNASQIGGFGTANASTSIGPNAVIDGATVEPGSIVGAGAHVVGVTIPAGFRVLPNAVITTQAQASNPAFGKVVRATASDISAIDTQLGNNIALASGYATLYQGQSGTGQSGTITLIAAPVSFFNGNLAIVRGANVEPGSPTVSFEPTRRGPRFQIPGSTQTFPGNFMDFPARITGGVIFANQTASQLRRSIGKHLSIRGDEGQPITIGSIAHTGPNVTIHAPRGGTLTIGRNLSADANAVILGGTGTIIGDNVSVGQGAVVSGASIGSGAIIGAGAYVSGGTIAAGTVVPAGAVVINGVRI
jgi:carbonic anhydrase/acetyltransferase-like protein (isoleucine patch superfamily)